MTLVLRAHGSSTAGMGHIARLEALGAACAQRGHRAILLTGEIPLPVRKRLLKNGLEVRTLVTGPSSVGGIDDARETHALAREANATWLVVDGYVFRPEYFDHFGTSPTTRLTLFDDNAHTDTPLADVVVDAAFQADRGAYKRSKPEAVHLLGPRYAVFRPEFCVASRAKTRRSLAGGTLLITMGGSDPSDATTRILRALQPAQCGLHEIVLVIGGLNTRLDDHFRGAVSAGTRLRLLRGVDNMAELMGRVDGAISAAGTTVYELALMQVPALIVPTAENQFAGARYIGERGLFATVPPLSSLSDEELREDVTRWIQGPAEANARVRAAARLVDAEGATRICEALEK